MDKVPRLSLIFNHLQVRILTILNVVEIIFKAECENSMMVSPDQEYQEAVNSNSQAASVWHWSDHDHFNSTNNEVHFTDSNTQ